VLLTVETALWAVLCTVETAFWAVLCAVETTFWAVEVTVVTGDGVGLGAGELDVAGGAGALGAGVLLLDPDELGGVPLFEELCEEPEPEPEPEDEGGELRVGAGAPGAEGVEPEGAEPVLVPERVVPLRVCVVDAVVDPVRPLAALALDEGPAPARATATRTCPVLSGATRRPET
jgi:hypothetical protein